MGRRLSLVMIALCAVAALAQSSAADDQAMCFSGGVADENVGACTRLIASSALRGNELVRAYLRRAFLHGRRGRGEELDRAISDAGEVLRREPTNAFALAIRASAYVRKGDLERAFTDLQEGVRLAPNDAAVRNVLGFYYLAKGDFDRALAELNEAFRLSPTNYFAYRTRGLVYEKKGEFEKARADFRMALRADPARNENLGREAAEGIERVEKVLAASRLQPTPQPVSGREQLSVNGLIRTYLIEKPAARGPRPTIIMLHGVGGSGAQEAQVSGLGQLGPQSDFTVVFPDGRGARWNYFPAGKVPASYVQAFRDSGGVPDDVTFLEMLVADLVRRGTSDPRRIYLAGKSAGGIMTLRMACADAGMFAAIAFLIAGMPELVGADCHPASPLPALAISGTADPFLPYGGGQIVSADPRLRSGELGSVWSMSRLGDFLRQLNRCSPTVEKSGLPAKIEVERSTGCSGGPVVLYRVVGGGHSIPSTLNAGQLLLDFFRDKVR
jgi:polyhydroxybutyrate depolymerase